jgi:hypothetical protein
MSEIESLNACNSENFMNTLDDAVKHFRNKKRMRIYCHAVSGDYALPDKLDPTKIPKEQNTK